MDKITWIGQAGLLFENNGYKIMLDPNEMKCSNKVIPEIYKEIQL